MRAFFVSDRPVTQVVRWVLWCSLFFPLFSNAEPLQMIGQIVTSKGDCTATNTAQKRSLAVDDEVFFHDLQQTASASRLSSQLADGSELTLGENASLRIDEFVYTPGSKGGRLSLKVLKGPFHFVGGKLDGDNKAEVTIGTRVATLGIRGTRVWGGMIDGAYGVLVLEGRVTVTNQAGRVVLGPGQGTMIKGFDSEPGTVKNWPQKKIDRALATVSMAAN